MSAYVGSSKNLKDLKVHITAVPETMREDGTFSDEPSAPPLRVQLDNIHRRPFVGVFQGRSWSH